MLVLRPLDLYAGVLAERHHDGERHREHEPVGVGEALAGPPGDEEAPQQGEPAVDPAEEDHLVAADAGHEARELGVVV